FPTCGSHPARPSSLHDALPISLAFGLGIHPIERSGHCVRVVACDVLTHRVRKDSISRALEASCQSVRLFEQCVGHRDGRLHSRSMTGQLHPVLASQLTEPLPRALPGFPFQPPVLLRRGAADALQVATTRLTGGDGMLDELT